LSGTAAVKDEIGGRETDGPAELERALSIVGQFARFVALWQSEIKGHTADIDRDLHCPQLQ
jgi:hypothetical protein